MHFIVIDSPKMRAAVVLLFFVLYYSCIRNSSVGAELGSLRDEDVSQSIYTNGFIAPESVRTHISIKN